MVASEIGGDYGSASSRQVLRSGAGKEDVSERAISDEARGTPMRMATS